MLGYSLADKLKSEESALIIDLKGNQSEAMQIAEGIASGTCMGGLKNEAAPQKVVFFDLEMSDIQFRSRYCEQYKDVEGKRQFHNEYKFNSS